MPHYLIEVRLDGIRGTDNLRVPFDYPVSVIAGGNGSGKSTVLAAAACAYKAPGAGAEEFVPSTLFPSYRPDLPGRRDASSETVLDYEYSAPDGRHTMRWKRGSKGWKLISLRHNNASQPERRVYLRTLGNPADPSEARGMIGMSRLSSLPGKQPLTASQIEFAQQILPCRYSEVVELSGGGKSLLFATRKNGAVYSELHMSGGERTILRLAQEVAQLRDGLVLIDGVEVGMHPRVQQLLMLQLQQFAWRNDLQIIVATHSPVVLDSVPSNGRIFLDRDEATGQVAVCPPYRDLLQDSIYGRSDDAVNLLCEGEATVGLLRGVVDYLSIEQLVRGETIRIGSATGTAELRSYVAALRKFGQIENFVFVLDGDKRGKGLEARIRRAAGWEVPVAFLPGDHVPEEWIWRTIQRDPDELADKLHVDRHDLLTHMRRLNSIYDPASDSLSEIARFKLDNLADFYEWEIPDMCRAVAYQEAGRNESDIRPFVKSLENAVNQWRPA